MQWPQVVAREDRPPPAFVWHVELALRATTVRSPRADKHKRHRQRLRQRKCKTASTSSPLCGWQRQTHTEKKTDRGSPSPTQEDLP